MGYNLAIEYLADYEKTWMLDSFRALNERVLVPQQRGLSQWLFLEVPLCHFQASNCPSGCKTKAFRPPYYRTMNPKTSVQHM